MTNRTPTTTARYPGTCPVSGQRYEAGAQLEKTSIGWALIGAQPAAVPVQRPENRLRTLVAADMVPEIGTVFACEGGVVVATGASDRCWYLSADTLEHMGQPNLDYGGPVTYVYYRLATPEEAQAYWSPRNVDHGQDNAAAENAWRLAYYAEFEL
ncbi:hypothetical protein [Deinococcus marmoris]|uniref:hypothetical protein n=1 Tax=Deinococcus marmoris TaxID=249408 RepID=UPI000496B347|nr:hypothetical protein [Deinococcus marmoris]